MSEGIEATIQRHHAQIVASLAGMGIGEQDRKDIMQDLYLKMVRRCKKLGALRPATAGAYLLRAAKSIAMQYFRRRRRLLSSPEAIEGLVDEQDLQAWLERRDAEACLRRAMGRLTTMQRHVMERILGGETPAQIAADNEWPVHQVWRAQRQAAVVLRKALKDA